MVSMATGIEITAGRLQRKLQPAKKFVRFPF